jgi:hypothetical protein
MTSLLKQSVVKIAQASCSQNASSFIELLKRKRKEKKKKIFFIFLWPFEECLVKKSKKHPVPFPPPPLISLYIKLQSKKSKKNLTPYDGEIGDKFSL